MTYFTVLQPEMKTGPEIKCGLLPWTLTNCEMFDVCGGELELFCSRGGIRAGLGNLKQEEEGQRRLTPSVSKGNRRLRVGPSRTVLVSFDFNVQKKKEVGFDQKADFSGIITIATA